MAGYIGSKASVVSSGAERKKTFAITTSTTSLTGLSYTVDQVHVFHNGVRLVDGTDYTATNGTSITLNSAAESGDEVVVISYAGFQVADAYTQAEADAEFVAKAGDTMTGDLDVTGTVTATDFAGDGSALTSLTAANLTGTLPAIDGSALTGVGGSTDAYAVGTYAHAAAYSASNHNIGDTVAGSSLFSWQMYSSSNWSGGSSTSGGASVSGSVEGTGSTSFTGTWRWMSASALTGTRSRFGIAVRIS